MQYDIYRFSEGKESLVTLSPMTETKALETLSLIKEDVKKRGYWIDQAKETMHGFTAISREDNTEVSYIVDSI